MICAQPDSNGYLKIVELASSENCEYYQLVEQTQLSQYTSQLDSTSVMALFGAAVGLYATTFVIKMVLQQLGIRG